MLHRFATYEEAAIFVAKKRSDGYYAEVLHDNCSSLWGPLAVSGVSAWVSEEVAEEEDELPDLELKGPKLPKELSMTILLATLSVPALIVAFLLFALLRHAVDYPLEAGAMLAALLVGALLIVLGIFALGAVACFSSRWLHALWNKSDPRNGQASALHVLLAVVLLLLATEASWLFWIVVDLLIPYSTY